MPRPDVLGRNSAVVAVGGKDPMEEGKIAEGRGGVDCPWGTGSIRFAY